MMQQEDHQQRLHQKETEAVRSLNSSQPTLIVVTGIMAAGKSTVARLLAQRFVQGVHIEADVLQRMIISGGVWVSQPGEPDGEAARQLRLRLKHLCLLGKSFVEAGFTVVLDDMILGDRWHQLQEELHGFPFSLVVLTPHVDVVTQQRDTNRSKDPQGSAWAVYLDQMLHTTMADIGLWIDTSELTPEETIEQILRRLSAS